MDVLITLMDTNEIKELETCATTNNLTAEQYASNIISQWLNNRVKNEYIEHIKKLNNSDIEVKFGDYRKLKE